MEAPLASQHREAILRSIPYIDADLDMREALYLFEERFYDIDVQVSQELVLNLSLFYLTYARLLTSVSGNDHKNARILMDTRKKIFESLDEISLKVAWIHNEPGFKSIIDKIHASLNTCTAALWHKHGYREAIEMYYPRPHEPDYSL